MSPVFVADGEKLERRQKKNHKNDSRPGKNASQPEPKIAASLQLVKAVRARTGTPGRGLCAGERTSVNGCGDTWVNGHGGGQAPNHLPRSGWAGSWAALPEEARQPRRDARAQAGRGPQCPEPPMAHSKNPLSHPGLFPPPAPQKLRVRWVGAQTIPGWPGDTSLEPLSPATKTGTVGPRAGAGGEKTHPHNPVSGSPAHPPPHPPGAGLLLISALIANLSSLHPHPPLSPRLVHQHL